MTYTINDVLAAMFSGRVSRMLSDIPSTASPSEIETHLAELVEGDSIPTAAEVIAAFSDYESLLAATPSATDPLEKLKAFLAANPDVAEVLK